MTRKIAVAVFFLLLAELAACQSVQVAPDVSEAQVREALNAARFSGAEVKSPYEYFSAQLYFERALVEQENGNHQVAQRYFARAYEQAMIAYEHAKKFRRNQ